MTDIELIEALHELDALYTQLPITREWNNPTHEDMIKSVNKAHSVNKALIRNVNTAFIALQAAGKRSTRLLWAFGITWTIFAAVLKWLIPYAVKGMAR